MCFKIYYMDPAKCLSTPGFVWQAALRIIKVKFELLISIYMLSMAEKVIRGEIRHTIDQYAKPNNKYMKDYDQNKETCYHKYQDINNLHGWAMLQKLPVNNFELIEDTSQINDNLYNEENDEEYFLKVDVQYPEKIHELHNDLPFFPERMKIEKFEKLVTNLFK